MIYPQWFAAAPCRGATRIMFPPGLIERRHGTLTGPDFHRRRVDALTRARVMYCDRCPHRRECAEFAAAHSGGCGIWAGEWADIAWRRKATV